MKRLLPAVLIAIFFHALFFAINTEWLIKKVARAQRPAITVTMSYKKKPATPAPVKKTPQKKPKEKKVKVVKKVQKPVPVVKKEVPEPLKEEVIVEEDIGPVEEAANDPDPMEVTDTGEYSDAVEESGSGTVSEAVPLYRMNPEPRYPKMARKRGYQGTVLLSVLVNKEGLVDDLWLYKSCGYKILDNAAIEAVKDWTFEPGKKGDDAVEMWVEVPVIFKLE